MAIFIIPVDSLFYNQKSITFRKIDNPAIGQVTAQPRQSQLNLLISAWFCMKYYYFKTNYTLFQNTRYNQSFVASLIIGSRQNRPGFDDSLVINSSQRSGGWTWFSYLKCFRYLIYLFILHLPGHFGQTNLKKYYFFSPPQNKKGISLSGCLWPKLSETTFRNWILSFRLF